MPQNTTLLQPHHFPLEMGFTFHEHSHLNYHQLMWTDSGLLKVGIEGEYWTLPGPLALIVPAGTRHTVEMMRNTEWYGVYLSAEHCTVPLDSPTPMFVNSLARELILYLIDEVSESERINAQNMLLQALSPVQDAAIKLPIPQDPRGRDIAELLLSNPADDRTLEELGHAVGVSPRTALRVFHAETGLTFKQWRTLMKLQSSLPKLADGVPVATVANQVGYATASAFVSAFKRVTGKTPAKFLSGRP